MELNIVIKFQSQICFHYLHFHSSIWLNTAAKLPAAFIDWITVDYSAFYPWQHSQTDSSLTLYDIISIYGCCVNSSGIL